MRLPLPGLAAAVATTAAALAAAAPAQGADAIFGGITKDGGPIVVKADAKLGELHSIVISWDAPCSDQRFYGGGGELTPTEPTPGFSPGPRELLVSRNAKGRFEGSQLYASDLGANVAAVSVKVTGKLKAKRASGTLTAIVKISDKASGAEVTSCQTGTKSWVATRAPGTIFGGATSQGEPIVLRLAPDGTRVNDVMTTWQAPCGESGFFRVPDHFVNFAVKSTGRFGNPFTDDVDPPRRQQAPLRLCDRGPAEEDRRQGHAAGQGGRDRSGGRVTNCDSGNVTWKAGTG